MPFCWGTSGLIVNKKFAPEASDYTDLLNPKYKGRISYRLKRPTLIGLAFALGYNPFELYSNPQEYAKMMEKIGEKLIASKSLVKNYWTNGDALLELLRSKEVFVAMGWDGGGWKLHKEILILICRSQKWGPGLDRYLCPACQGQECRRCL